MTAAPDFEGQDLVDESAITDVLNLLVDIRLQRRIESCLPENVGAGWDQVDS